MNRLNSQLKSLKIEHESLNKKVVDYLASVEGLSDKEKRALFFENFDTTEPILLELYRACGLDSVIESERSMYEIENLGLREVVYSLSESGQIGVSNIVGEFIKLVQTVPDYLSFHSLVEKIKPYSNTYNPLKVALLEAYKKYESNINKIALKTAVDNLSGSGEAVKSYVDLMESLFIKNLPDSEFYRIVEGEFMDIAHLDSNVKFLVERASLHNAPKTFNGFVSHILENVNDPDVESIIERVVGISKNLSTDEQKMSILLEKLSEIKRKPLFLENLLSKYDISTNVFEKDRNELLLKEAEGQFGELLGGVTDVKLKEKLNELKSLLAVGISVPEFKKILERELRGVDVDDPIVDEFLRKVDLENKLNNLGIAESINVLLQDADVLSDATLVSKLNNYKLACSRVVESRIAEQFCNDLAAYQYMNAVNNAYVSISGNYSAVKPYAMVESVIAQITGVNGSGLYSEVIEKLNRCFYLPEYQVATYVILELSKYQNLLPQIRNLVQSFKMLKASEGTAHVATAFNMNNMMGEVDTPFVKSSNIFSPCLCHEGVDYFSTKYGYYSVDEAYNISRVSERVLPESLRKVFETFRRLEVDHSGVSFSDGVNKVRVERLNTSYPTKESIKNTLGLFSAQFDVSESVSETGVFEHKGYDVIPSYAISLLDAKYGDVFSIKYEPSTKLVEFQSKVDDIHPAVDKRLYVDGKEVSTNSLGNLYESLRIGGVYLSQSNLQKLSIVWENFESLVRLDFGTLIESKVRPGLAAEIFRIGDVVYMNAVNGDSKFSKVSGDQAVLWLKENLQIDAKSLFVDLLGESVAQREKLKIRKNELRGKISIVEAQLKKINEQPKEIQNDENVSNLKSTLEATLSELKETYFEIDKSLSTEYLEEVAGFNTGDLVKIISMDMTGSVQSVNTANSTIMVLTDEGETLDVEYSDLKRLDKKIEKMEKSANRKDNLTSIKEHLNLTPANGVGLLEYALSRI